MGENEESMSKPVDKRVDDHHNDGMRWRRVALLAGIIVLAGGLGAGIWALQAYNQVTKIDRSDPEVVADEYLRALLVRKDKIGADLYACDDQVNLASINALRDELDQREKDFGVTIEVTWGAYTGGQPLLATTLTITARKGVAVDSREQQDWRFTMTEDDGWRVCGAEKIEENPT